MDASRFDRLLRSLTTGYSRRSALGRLASTALLSLSATAAPMVDAKKKGKKKKAPCCRANCAGKVCGDDGCGGVCGFPCEEFKTCCQGTCKFPTGEVGCCMAVGEPCSPDGGSTYGPSYCCSKSCDNIGADKSNLCI